MFDRHSTQSTAAVMSCLVLSLACAAPRPVPSSIVRKIRREKAQSVTDSAVVASVVGSGVVTEAANTAGDGRD